MNIRLSEEIKRAMAYQSSIALVVFNVDKIHDFQSKCGLLQTEAALKRVALLIRDSIAEIGYAGRIAEDEFAVLLPEKNKRQAHEIAEAIRQKISSLEGDDIFYEERLTLSGGVSENPLDGTTADQLFSRARTLLQKAKEQGRNCVVSYEEPPSCR